MRLLVDANLSPRLAGLLRDDGHDAVHVFDLGLARAKDREILGRADADQRVILSSDTDFGTLLATSDRSSPSFVLLRHSNNLSPDDQAVLLRALLPTVATELQLGAVVSISRGRVRIRR